MTQSPPRATTTPLAHLFAGVSCVLLAFGATQQPADAQSLRGSTRSMDRQETQAQAHDFTYLRSSAQVRRFVERGYLVPVRSNRNFRLKSVSFPYGSTRGQTLR